MLGLAPLILRNVLRNRRRTLLTLASTAVSLALLSLMLALYQGLFHRDQASPSEAMRLVVRHNVSLTQPLPSSYQAKIRAIPGVDKVTALSWFQGEFMGDPNKFDFARFAADADTIFVVHPDWVIPADQLEAFKKLRTGCAISERIAKQKNLKLGQTVTVKGDIYPVNLELRLVAIFKSPPTADSLVFHREYLRELLPDGDPNKDTVGTYLVLAKSPGVVTQVANAIDDQFSNSPAPTRAESEQAFSRSFLGFLGNIKLFLMAICSAVTFTILLVSANTVSMAVRERTREMAILRTLGYRPSEILELILGEAVCLSIFGGILGLGIGMLMSYGLEAAAPQMMQSVRWQAGIIVVATAAVVGLLSAILPAFIASRKNVVESLRFTG